MSQLAGLGFGSGIVLGAPQPTTGNPAANPTPLTLGVIQNVKFTLGADIKSLFGLAQWPVDSAIGKRSIKGTLEFAQISNILLSQLFTGDVVTAGVVATVFNEAGSVPAVSGPYTITVAESAHYVADFGVVYAATGQPLIHVASGPTVGQYSVNVGTGVYTFAAADTLAAVLISYTWTDTTAGNTMAAGNHPMGYGPVVQLNVIFPYDVPVAGGMGFLFPNVRLGKIDATTKIDDYTMYQSDFEAFAGANNTPFVSYQAW